MIRLLLAAITVIPMTLGTARAESLSSCDQIKRTQGVQAWLTCVARQAKDNYLPGAGAAPGMAMDEMDNQINRELCTGMCEGRDSGAKIGDCTCK